MRLDELATVKLKPDPPSFDEKNALQFLKTLKDHERSISKTSDFLSSLKDSLSHSPPTHDNRLKKFKVTLPKFKDFHDQLKKSAPGVTAAQAFNNLSLIRKGLSGLADYRQISLHKSVKMKLAATCANKNTKKIIFDT